MAIGYRLLLRSGELERRAETLSELYKRCVLCPHQCRVDRISGQRGICGQTSDIVVASANVHNGEEPPISGSKGSGTIFFSGCPGHCIFCQNYPISQLGTGNTVSVEQLAEMMIDLQERGCHNINFVTPTHYIPSFVSALVIAARNGLQIPIVYNSSGYERVEILALLEGIVDIYLPDAKYADNSIARELSGFKQYVEYNREALKEMYRQVGKLRMKNGLAVKGLIIRHLILPDNLSGTDDVLSFCADMISPDVHISLMNQYFPAHKALDHPVINRRVSVEEYDRALESFDNNGLHNGWIQEFFFV